MTNVNPAAKHTENFDEKMNGFKVCQFVVICIHTKTEEQACISSIYDFVVPELLAGEDSAPAAKVSLTHFNKV